ncbi:hypothetical protein [Lunatimonas salinarum]|uniref:hypothetical protein n=1 Tax=Lunatimonas salinarum TaxID=1774590 RepID=UPI001AE07219|nr:hypothetical protein [Lunatimonas salinarum]
MRCKIRKIYDATSFPKPRIRSNPNVIHVTQYIAEGIPACRQVSTYIVKRISFYIPFYES